MKRKGSIRVLAMTLVLSLIVNLCPGNVYADSNYKDTAYTQPERESVNLNSTSKEGLVVEKTENSTTFEYEDGRKETVMYGSDVRYKDSEGNLVDYDPALVEVQDKVSNSGISLEDYAYENSEGDKKQYIPNEISEETPLLMEYGKHVISMSPIVSSEKVPIIENSDTESAIDQLEQKQVTEEFAKRKEVASVEEYLDGKIEDVHHEESVIVKKPNNFSKLTNNLSLDWKQIFNPAMQVKKVYDVVPESLNDLSEEVDIKKEVVEDLYEQKKEIDNTATYETEDNSASVEYTSEAGGIKETIVLNEKPESNLFSFRLHTKNATPRVSEKTNEIYIYDNTTNHIIAMIEAPFMNDATNDAYSEDIKYQIIKDTEEDTYLLHLIISREYLDDVNREYPVKIDPSIAWADSSKIKDAYVINSDTYEDTNFYTNDIASFAAGNGQ